MLLQLKKSVVFWLQESKYTFSNLEEHMEYATIVNLDSIPVLERMEKDARAGNFSLLKLYCRNVKLKVKDPYSPTHMLKWLRDEKDTEQEGKQVQSCRA